MQYVYTHFKDFEPYKLKFVRQEGNTPYPRYICRDYISLDTETSKNEDNTDGWMYQWCFSYPTKNRDIRLLVYGRKPSDLAEALLKIIEVNKLAINNYQLPIFIHNVSFDYFYFKDYLIQYLKARYGDTRFDKKRKMLAISNKKILTFEVMGLFFKCSFKLVGKSLAAWGKELNVAHPKLVGEIDYNVIRYQDTPLTRSDWRYMFRDVICLDECILGQLALHKDTIKTVPLTVTGYVRRELRKEFRSNRRYRKDFLKKELTPVTFELLRREYAGGLTHGNRYMANKTVTVLTGKYKGMQIKHRDFRSHFPSQERCNSAPTSAFTPYYTFSEDNIIDIKDVLKLAKKRCILVTITISDVEIKEGVTCPILQASKVKAGRIGNMKSLDLIEDNGRVLKMVSGLSTIVVNEYDLKWLYKQYNFNYMVLDIHVATRGKYPKWLRDTVDKFMYGKTKYKALEQAMDARGISDISPEYIENHQTLMLNKGMLNGIYGCTATSPIRVTYDENEDGEWFHKELTEDEISEALKRYYASETNFNSYDLGCWTTASARDELLFFIELIGYENFLYADTDSIFYLSTPEIEERIEAVNKRWRDRADREKQYIEYEGKRVHYHQFELEKEDIVEFRFLHAKCYAYVTSDGKLHATIAGVKKVGRNGNNRVKELGDINELEMGKKFIDCGGTSCTYINRKPDIKNINGHLTEVASAAIIKETEKTLKSELDVDDTIFTWF